MFRFLYDKAFPPQNTVEAFCRKFGLPRNFVLPSDTKAVLQSLSEIGVLETSCIRPLVDNSPTQEAIEKWKKEFISIFVDKSEGERIAIKIINSLNRVDQITFEMELLKVFLEFSKEVQPNSNMAYVYFSGGRERSNKWVLSLLRDYSKDNPLLNLDLLDTHKFSDDTISQNKISNLETAVILDDAIYSATQCKSIINAIFSYSNSVKKFFVVVPYITSTGLEALKSYAAEKNINLTIKYRNLIPTVKEILGDKDFNTLKSFKKSAVDHFQGLTYFSHKVPDYRSFCPFIASTRYVEVDSFVHNMMPSSLAVYHAEYMSYLKEKKLI